MKGKKKWLAKDKTIDIYIVIKCGDFHGFASGSGLLNMERAG